ncbi:MAG: hypothetical protein JEZ08_02180 [Clostridiales bacterium]|nr:hypothetical protein [Clostridiales bacterium]
MNKILNVVNKLSYIITVTIVILFYIKREFIPFGFITLLIGGFTGLIFEILNKKKIVLMIMHTLGILISSYAIWIWIAFDPVVTVINF